MLSSHLCFCLLTRLVLHHVALCGGRGPLHLGSVSKASLLSVVIGLCAITCFAETCYHHAKGQLVVSQGKVPKKTPALLMHKMKSVTPPPNFNLA